MNFKIILKVKQQKKKRMRLLKRRIRLLHKKKTKAKIRNRYNTSTLMKIVSIFYLVVPLPVLSSPLNWPAESIITFLLIPISSIAFNNNNNNKKEEGKHSIRFS